MRMIQYARVNTHVGQSWSLERKDLFLENKVYQTLVYGVASMLHETQHILCKSPLTMKGI